MQATGTTLETPASSTPYIRRPRLVDLKQNALDKVVQRTYIQPTAFRRSRPNHSPWKPSPPPYLTVGPPCHLSANRSPSKPRCCTSRFQIPFSPSFPREDDTTPLSHSVAKYVHPTRHIAVKSTSDISLRASASMQPWDYIGKYHACAVLRYSVHPTYMLGACYVCVRLLFCAVMGVWASTGNVHVDPNDVPA
ncbi:unnamed protein product [Penicillium roqueforti FM164]|uniref:Genomic scaffold, ProqFM164S04 n=1 Tax=Penicillium roqueforti (strain FM164) TaxID=1365484 RepID=W6R0X2_PENRF|nr:unnamed protein product [Penicillium roqueforti FM164]